ncbi:conserved hypothetical protein [Alteracholeplasma palmae J233]|uniref:ATPase AAA-type core domain-containing protein n=1 Tax=Alteracholeplasma palmae (strain ATCC 49389 / J233) TaxID=1318466 RepID=U4KKI9_ALTPJ|nr:AAA family ATPase [Alteracholeplasma palmae]CCV64103.1 conserved hypothetical protein [Alteracholeplasma palmae J233]
MRTYITKLYLNGVKNISKPIEMNFYKKTIGKKIDLNETNIKAIYGANGAGKSAIIQALLMYERLNNSSYLYNDRNVLKLKELVNKITNQIDIKVEFLVYDQDDFSIKGQYEHELVLERMGNEFIISKEYYAQIMSNGKRRVYFDIYNGKILELYDDSIKDMIQYQCEKRTVRSILFDNSTRLNDEAFRNKVLPLYPIYSLARNINIKTEETDQHNYYIYTHTIQKNDDQATGTKNIQRDSRYSYVLDKVYRKDFVKHIKNMERFLKIFKTDLLKIDLDEKVNKDELIMTPYFIYKTYKVHIEFESAGIKKLIELYDLFVNKENGDIVIIDELDANINDVYLIKLLEYFKSSSKGQLIFTTHNASPMQVLASSKYALDFITESGEITEWKKNGNATALNTYHNGMIKGLPFNVDSFDFIGVFEEDDE